MVGRYFVNFDSIKFVVSEIDGVVTEHLAGLGELNTVLFKQFCLKDFEAINLIKHNWGFAFLSSEAVINLSLCKKRNIPFFHAEKNKLSVFKNLIQRYNITPDDVLYIGSSYSDTSCAKLAGISMCPEDGVPQMKNIVDRVIPVYSGTGVLCYVYEVLDECRLKKNREE